MGCFVFFTPNLSEHWTRGRNGCLGLWFWVNWMNIHNYTSSKHCPLNLWDVSKVGVALRWFPESDSAPKNIQKTKFLVGLLSDPFLYIRHGSWTLLVLKYFHYLSYREGFGATIRFHLTWYLTCAYLKTHGNQSFHWDGFEKVVRSWLQFGSVIFSVGFTAEHQRQMRMQICRESGQSRGCCVQQLLASEKTMVRTLYFKTWYQIASQ